MTSLLQRLRQAGRLDSHGFFTVDLEKARQKMARFQLTDPRRYILEVVQAALALGASAIEVETGPGAVEVRFDGRPLPAARLAEIDSCLFVSPADDTEVALRHLAVALNAVATLKPRQVVVETPEGSALERGPRGDRLLTRPVRLHRLRLEAAGSGPPERSLLQEEAAFCPVPLRVDGGEVGRGFPFATLAPPREWKAPGARGLAGLPLDPERAQLVLVSRGVVVGRRQPRLATPLCALVWCDDLTRNASHSDVVEDRRYQDLLGRLEEVGQDCVADLAGRYPQGGPAARQLLLHQLRHRLPPRGPRQPWQEALAACPLFLTPAGRPLSLAQLEEQRRRLGFVPVVAGRQGADPADLLVALLDHPLVEKILQAHFGKAVRDVEERLLAELARQANRQRWEQSPRPAELPPGRWLARRRLSDPPGEVGLEEEIRPPSLLQVLYQGRLLTSLEVDDGLDWTAVLDLAEVEILPDWSGPAQGPLWKAAWGRLQAEVETLYASLAALPLEQAGPRLLLAMSCGGRGEPYRSLPLFTDLTGRAWSVAELEGQEPWLVPRSCLPLLLRLPHHLLPGGPVLPVSPLEEQALRAQPLKVRDLAPLLERLQEVARALEQPQEPRIEEPCLVRLTWQEEDSRGELGLPLEAEPHQGRLRLLHRGVFLGERRLRHQGPGFLAVVDSARLTPNADWSSFAADGAWNELVRRVRQAAREAEERLLAELPARPGEAFRRALEALAAAHPQHPALQEAPLFAGVPEPLSPRRIRAEMEAHGHVLWGARGRGLPGRPFLLDSDPASLRLLERLCPGVRLRPLEEALQEVAPRPTLKLRVQGSVLARQALDPPRQGEVALTAEGGGDVAVYRQGRLQATVEGALPDGLRAVVEDPALGGGTSGAPWKALLEELGRTASRLIEGQLPRARPGSTLATALLSLSSWNLLEGEVRERLLAAPLIPMLAAPPLGLAALRERLKGRKTLPYTPAGPPVEPLDGRPVVRAPAAFATALARLCGCRAQDDRQELAQDRVYRWNLARARRLPTRLPACLQTLAVDGEGLKGEAGIPLRDPGRLVFCDDQGPMGSQLWPGPAMGAVLRGTFRLSRRGDQVLLSKEQERFLRRLCTDLYAALVDSLGPRPDADRRRRLLEFVRQERRSLGSRQATGELLARILRLPLVPAAQGAWVSLETLLQEARARGVLTYLAAPGPVPPGGEGAFPVLRRRSLERGVLAEMLGEERLVVARPGLDAWRAVRQAADRARQASSRFWGWLAGEGQELGAWLHQVGQSAIDLVPDRVETARPARPEPELPRLLRRSARLVLVGRGRRSLLSAFDRLAETSAPFGEAAVWLRDGRLAINRMSRSVRQVKGAAAEDPEAVLILVSYLVGRIQERLGTPPADQVLSLVELAGAAAAAYGEHKP